MWALIDIPTRQGFHNQSSCDGWSFVHGVDSAVFLQHLTGRAAANPAGFPRSQQWLGSVTMALLCSHIVFACDFAGLNQLYWQYTLNNQTIFIPLEFTLVGSPISILKHLFALFCRQCWKTWNVLSSACAPNIGWWMPLEFDQLAENTLGDCTL